MIFQSIRMIRPEITNEMNRDFINEMYKWALECEYFLKKQVIFKAIFKVLVMEMLLAMLKLSFFSKFLILGYSQF